MLAGYLVSLGNNQLDSGDTVATGMSAFTPSQDLGTGTLSYSYDDGAGGTINTTATGTYVVGTDGGIYFVPDTNLEVLTAASVLSAPTYDVVTGTASNETINGTADDEVIYGGSQGATTSTGSDTINAGDGNDIIYGGDGNNVVYGGDGDDTVVIQGNLNGNDTFYGGTGSDTMVLSPDDDRDLTIDMSTNSVSDGLGGGQYFYDVENITTAGGDDTVLGDANDNTIITNAGNDTVNSGAGNDTVVGGHGDDTITTGSGDDTVYGDSGEIPTGTTEHVSWNNDGTLAQFSDLSGGFTQNTGTMNVTFTQVNDGAMGVTQNYNGTHYTEAGDPWSSTSSLYVTGTGGADVSTSTLTFNPVDATAIEDEVSNVSFRINDIDQSAGGWRDQLIVRAYDADGNEVPVVITAAGNDVVANGNVTAGNGNDSHTGFNGSVLFEIPGPVHEITIDYNNAGDPAGQFVLVSDVYFDTIPVNTGSDSITTGAGEDLIYGEEGDDNIDGGADNDTIFGGAGNDTITGSLGSDSISGGEGDDYIQGDATTDTTYTVTSSSLLATNPAARVDDDATLAVAFTNPTEISLDFSSMENNEENLIYIDGELVDLQTLLDNGLVTLTSGLAVGPNGGVIGTTNPGSSTSGTLTFNYPVSEISIDHTGGGWDNVTVNYETGGSYTAITDYTNGATGTFATDATGDGDDNIDGGDGNDVIISGGGADTVEGGLGDDSLYGGDGADTMFGGEGNDYIEYGEGADTVYGGAGNDVIDDVNGGAFTEGSTVYGDAGDDRAYGTAGNDFLDGGTGNDTMFGEVGNDTLTGGEGTDSLYGAQDSDTFLVDGDDDLTYIYGGETTGDWDVVDFDTAAGGDGVDVTYTTTENGSFSYTGGGSDGTFQDIEAIDYTEGDDTADASALTTGMSIDTAGGNDTIIGGSGDDTLSGGAGDDSIAGGLGADTMYGGEGNDTITFADGDTAEGGDGDDLFVLTDLGEPENGVITIVGGEGNETNGDTLQLGTLGDFTTLNITTPADEAGGMSGTITLDDGTILNFSEIENIICFTPDTQIVTPQGSRTVQDLRPGDLVVTRDHGLQPIRWIKSRTVPALDRFAPIRIKQGVLSGQQEDILVSPQHRMLFTGYQSELLFGDSEVLVSAKHLVDGRDVTIETGGFVTYYHILFDEHEIIYANGAASESFHPGEIGLSAVTDEARDELFALFPELRSLPSSYGATARRCLKKHEAGLL